MTGAGAGIGERRVGDYTLLGERFRDEVGTLWEARDGRTGAAVELRLLPAGLARNSLVHVRFLRDAARAAAVAHPSVVPVLDGGEAGGELFLASAPAGGRTLQSLLEEARAAAPPDGVVPLPGEGRDGFARVAEFFRRLALALEAVHAAGLVHGRLDPRRVLVLPDGTPLVRDLGLPGAGILGELSLDRAPVRATAWSSPESLDPTELLEPRADVYSLGALLYQALSLRPPHEEATTEGLAWRLRSHDPTPLRRWNPAVPRPLARIVGNAMARDRGPRYTSARDLAADLALFLEGKAVALRKEPLPARLVRWPVRHPVLVFNLLLLAMAVEAVVLLWGASIPLGRALEENVQLSERNRIHARRIEAMNLTEGWAQMARALEPLLEASRDLGGSDPDLAILLARTALDRARAQEWRNSGDAAAFRRRALDRLRECLHDAREVAHTSSTGVPASLFAKAGDGSGRFAVGSPDGTLRILDAGGRLLGVGNSHRGEVRGVRAQPGGALLLTGSADGTARTWGGDGREIAVYAGHEAPVNAAAASRGGSRLLTGSDDGTAILWRSNGDRLAVLRGHGGPVLDAAFDAGDGGLLTASADVTARVWTAEGKERFVLAGHAGEVRRILPWRLGTSAWLTLSADGTMRTWSAEGAPLLVLRHGGAPTCFADGGGGRLLTGDEEGTLRLWDGEGRVAASIAIPGCRITGVDRSPETGLLLAAGSDGTVRLFTEAGAEVDRFSAPGGGAALGGSFAPGGEVVHGAFEDGSIRTWNRGGGELGVWREAAGRIRVSFLSIPFGGMYNPPRSRPAPDLAVMAGTPEGKGRTLAILRPGAPVRRWRQGDGSADLLAASRDRGATLTGGDDGILRLRWFGVPEGEEFGDAGPPVTVVRFTESGGIVAGSADGAVRHWDANGVLHDGEATAGPPHGSPIRAVAWDPGTGTLAVGAEDGTVAFHRKSFDRKLSLGRPVAGLAWSRTQGPGPARVLLVAARDGTFGVLDDRFRLLQKEWRRLPEGSVLSVAAADDGSFLVLTESGGGSCRAWRISRDMQSVERLAVLEGTGAVASADLDGGTGNGRWRAATASADGTVRLFALDEGGVLDAARLRVPRDFTEEEKARLSRLSLRPPAPVKGKR